MERSTKKCDVITRTTASVGETEYVVKENKFGNAINKLGELEDIMEKYNIEYPNMLDFYLQTINNLNIQNDNLRTELAELKQKAIVPKFKIGDKVYAIIDTFAYTDVFPVEIRDAHLLYEVWDGQDTTKQHFTRIFATKAEAEQKLAEIKGKKHE